MLRKLHRFQKPLIFLAVLSAIIYSLTYLTNVLKVDPVNAHSHKHEIRKPKVAVLPAEGEGLHASVESAKANKDEDRIEPDPGEGVKPLHDPDTRPAYNRNTWLAANYDVHVFYYIWYGAPAIDKEWYHWNHRYLPHWDAQVDLRYPKGRHSPPLDIGANFYPKLGPYSSADPDIMDQHMYDIRKARIGVVTVSWYPPGASDDEGQPPDRLIPLLLDTAAKYDVKVCFHIEPFEGRTVASLRKAIKYLMDSYGSHPALYKRLQGGRELPVYYMYDSYQVPEDVWRELFSRLSENTVRDTELDGVFFGLAVEAKHPEQLYNSGFDGIYTYFASNTFVYGSMPHNWHRISKYCKSRELLFSPSVGPGYIDTEVRPWNERNTKDRDQGNYYRRQFKMALSALPDVVSITSYNEWHEGTQIEPAIPKTKKYNVKYLDYGPNANMYMELTRELIESMPSTRVT